ncbi:hypothetical protein AGMMS49944_00840 [Spirochaetia bacterium]|nr:hypothetical protein AGMMS49944_00840 [Spirochaetia bacterium]
MTGWDGFDRILNGLSPVALAILLIAAVAGVVIFIIGFSRRGMNFVKYGFGHTMLDSSLESRFDSLEAKIGAMDTKISLIETNHFAHLKGYLELLNGIFLDKNIINNEMKARLDNELRGM